MPDQHSFSYGDIAFSLSSAAEAQDVLLVINGGGTIRPTCFYNMRTIVPTCAAKGSMCPKSGPEDGLAVKDWLDKASPDILLDLRAQLQEAIKGLDSQIATLSTLPNTVEEADLVLDRLNGVVAQIQAHKATLEQQASEK